MSERSIHFIVVAHLSGRRVPIALVALSISRRNQTIGIGRGFRLRVAVSDPVLQLAVDVLVFLVFGCFQYADQW